MPQTMIKKLATDLQNKQREQSLLNEMIKCLDEEIELYGRIFSQLCSPPAKELYLLSPNSYQTQPALQQTPHSPHFRQQQPLYLPQQQSQSQLQPQTIQAPVYQPQLPPQSQPQPLPYVYNQNHNHGFIQPQTQPQHPYTSPQPYNSPPPPQPYNSPPPQQPYYQQQPQPQQQYLYPRVDLSDPAHNPQQPYYNQTQPPQQPYIQQPQPPLTQSYYTPQPQPYLQQPQPQLQLQFQPQPRTIPTLPQYYDDDVKQSIAFLRPVMGTAFDDPVLLKQKVETLLNLAQTHQKDLLARLDSLVIEIEKTNYLVEQASVMGMDEVLDLVQSFSLTDEEEKLTTSSAFTIFKKSTREIKDKQDLQPGMHVFCYRFGPFSHHGVCIQDPENGLIVVHLNGGATTVGYWVRSQLFEAFNQKHNMPPPPTSADSSVIKAGTSIAYVQPVTVEEFSMGDKIHVATYKYEAPYDLTAARAWKSIWTGQYNFVTRNCEHFSTYCKTGCGVSLQVTNVHNTISSVGQFLNNMGAKLDTGNTQVALLKMPQSVLQQISSFTDNQAKKFSVNYVNFK